MTTDFVVDCLTAGGPTATVTGRLVRTSPGHPWQTHLDPNTRMGLGFHVPGDGEARVGMSGATAKGAPLLTKCMAPAADMAVVEGGYALQDRDRDRDRDTKNNTRAHDPSGSPARPGGIR